MTKFCNKTSDRKKQSVTYMRLRKQGTCGTAEKEEGRLRPPLLPVTGSLASSSCLTILTLACRLYLVSENLLISVFKTIN